MTEPEPTVGQALDQEIHRARKRVEELCIKKAKAEALNMLDFPAEFVRDLIPHPF